MYETLRRGQVLLNNPSLIIISTAGFNLYGGPMFEEYKYITKVLEGTETNENYFIFCAEQDSEDEIHKPETWIKSNPLLEVESLKPTLMRNLQAEVDEGIAKHDINGILVKNFNLWRQSSEETYIAYQDWEACYTDSELDITGRDVYFGIDLSRQDDMSAVGIIFPLEDKKYFVDSHIFLGFKHSIAEKSQRDKIDYMKLIDTDMATLTNTESGIINYEQIIEWLIEYVESNNLNVKGIMYDPWNSQAVIVS
jgi:phage terminase large subunit-like protein